MNKKATILVVDDERGVRQSFNMVLKDEYRVLLAGTGKKAVEIYAKHSIDLVLLDILLPDINGLELLGKLKEAEPGTEIIMVTAVNEIRSAVKAIKLGAYEYIIKPFIVEDVLTVISRALEKRQLVKEVTYLRNELERYHSFEQMVGKDRKMGNIFELISKVSQSDATVLIQGDSGTGKELVARAIHNRSPRHKQPFVVINCAAIPATLMESEVFGHNKGAFTGATGINIGKIEIANKGTVFLDDIDSLDINMQAKLLRVIQEKEFERVGSSRVIKAEVRFVAASNQDLSKLISQGKFREDLFYRLNVFTIKLPPLRKRRGDIPLLLEHFSELYSKKTGKPGKKFSGRAIKVLMEYDWPGNVRELQNLVERLCTIKKDAVIHRKDVASFIIGGRGEINDMSLKEAVNMFEKEYITATLDTVDGNRRKASQRLGIHRNTLLSKINDLGLDV
ncbi:MAG: sigma-54 dependent transcriptional regulator [Thermodesulfobacteriota bacterium]|nr:sigma-54 dependent transcriptional regulator [Thermodesulfobacteriota bacterium]